MIMKKMLYAWLGFLVLLSGCALPAHSQEKKDTKTISIADKKYEADQLKIAVAIKDAQNAALQAQNDQLKNQMQQAQAQENLNQAVKAVLAEVGISAKDATDWIYDPQTMVFTKKAATPAQNKKP